MASSLEECMMKNENSAKLQDMLKYMLKIFL